MRITCEAEWSDRRLPSLGCAIKKGWTRMSVSIGRWPSTSSSTSTTTCQIHVLLCSAQNRAGTKYRVSGNVRQLFTKFVAEGRVTISFETPPHDIFIRKADPLQLRSFLKVLNGSSTNGSHKTVGSTERQISLLRPATASQIRPLKTKLVISERRLFPSSDGFPSSLTILRVNNCSLKKVDSRILKLRQLQELDFSDNVLQSLPDELGTALPCLQVLNVARNQLVRLTSSSLGSYLINLDVSNNRLESLCVLDSCTLLTTLRLDNNCLKSMPERIHLLRKLRKLTASNNFLKYLPTGVLHLRLEFIGVGGNPFDNLLSTVNSSSLLASPSALLELAARTILHAKLTISENDLPRNLLAYLADEKMCLCGMRFVSSPVDETIFKLFDLHQIASTIITDSEAGTRVPVRLQLCSLVCAERFANRHRK